MAQYSWSDLRFTIPDGMSDQTVVTLMDDEEAPTFNITVTSEAVKADLSFDDYVADQVSQLGENLEGYKLLKKTDREVGKFPTQLLEQEASGPEGEKLQQMQAYIRQPERVVVVSVTAAAAGKEAANAALEKLLTSLQFG